MASEEKQAWIYGVVAVIGYTVYLALLLTSGTGSLLDRPYAPLMLWTIGGGIVAGIVAGILVGIVSGMFSPKEAGKRDQRDREISRFGEHVGQSFLVIGGVAALLLALAEVDHFWIANVLYLGFVLSAIFGALTRIVAYRRGLPEW